MAARPFVCGEAHAGSGNDREGDVQRLRDGGLSDAAIHDLVAVAAYFNFVNRMALGLGVEMEASPRPAPPPSG